MLHNLPQAIQLIKSSVRIHTHSPSRESPLCCCYSLIDEFPKGDLFHVPPLSDIGCTAASMSPRVKRKASQGHYECSLSLPSVKHTPIKGQPPTSEKLPASAVKTRAKVLRLKAPHRWPQPWTERWRRKLKHSETGKQTHSGTREASDAIDILF